MILPDWTSSQELIPPDLIHLAAAHAPEADRTRDLSPEVLAGLKVSRANRALLAPAVGGTHPVRWVELGRAMAALGGACPSTTWVFNNFITNQYELARQLWQIAPERVRALAEEGAFLAGSHAGPPEARVEGDTYVLRGLGTFGSGAIYADCLCGSIRVPGPPPERPSLDMPFHVRYTVYDPGQPGLRVERTWTGAGLRASATDSIHYDDVTVLIRATAFTPERSPTPAPRVAPHALLAESFSITSACLFSAAAVGIATEILRLTIEQLGVRTVRGGGTASALPDVQSGIGRALHQLVLAAYTVEAALAAADDRRARGVTPTAGETASMHLAAIAAMEAATESAQISFRMLGGTGLREGSAERLWRDIQGMGLHITLQPHVWHGRYGNAELQGGRGVVPIV